MQPGIHIEAVGARERGALLRFLIAGARSDMTVALRAEAYERMIARCDGGCWFRTARRVGRVTAAALVVTSPGRVGMLFYAPPTAPGVDVRDLPVAIRSAADAALGAGLSFVQALVPPGRGADLAALHGAGFRRLAELIYMRLNLRSARPVEPDVGWTWRNARTFRGGELAEVIRGTYEESLDCPGLCGLRDLDDVLVSHRATGIYSPRSWWIAERAARPAGCLLVNDSAREPGGVEIVYMGVLRAFRGRGLARTMVRRAARWARRRRKDVLTVVVDGENTYARRVYEAEGFLETDRRQAWYLPRAASQEAAARAGFRGC